MYCTKKARWQKVSRAHRCPICGKPDWCLFTGPAHNPEAAICARVESTKIVGTKGAGWLHRLRDDDGWRGRPRRRQVRVEVEVGDIAPGLFRVMAKCCEDDLGARALRLLAAELGVTPDSLRQLQVGWSQQHRSFTFPMRDADGEVVGVRLRGADGRKWAAKGSKQGLFIPLCDADRGTPGIRQLLVCEGPTDCAAMIDLNFAVIGRPSCGGGSQLIFDLVCDWQPESLAIIADRDGPGQCGARSLAAKLVGCVAAGVRIVTPPVKDAREWVKWLQSSGISWEKTRLEVQEAIEAAPIMQLHYGVKGGVQ